MWVFGGIEPDAASRSLLTGYGPAHAKYLFDADPEYGQVQSGGLPLLINEAGRLVYFGAVTEYALNAYAKTYFGASIEYMLGGIVPLDLTDTLVGTSAFGLLAELGMSFGSSFDATSAMAMSKLVDMSMDSTGAFTSAFSLNYEISLVIAEVLEAVAGFGVEGQDIPIWVFNAKTFAPSRYEGLDVRSLAKLGTTVYGAGPGGIYELAGDTDAGAQIAASFIVGRAGFGAPNVKRIAYGYITGTSDANKLQVRVITDTGQVYTYEAERALGNQVRSVRFKAGKGLKGHYWQFEVRNQNGGAFEVHHIDLLPEVLARWTKG
ncbi:MAG: hypothetical protein ACREXX_18050 [Gammaproteobacteria bacterium]